MAETGFKARNQAGKIYKKIVRPSKAVIAELAKGYSGFILDRLGKRGALSSEIKPLSSGMRICGPAVTCQGADLSVRRAAIDLAEAGDVLVVAAGASPISCFGDGTARRLMLKGLTGAVLDAPTRDAAALRTLSFSTFSRGVSPRNHHYPLEVGQGAVNVPVVVGGVLVNPGDVIFGDDDGLVVVPRDLCDDIAEGLSLAIAQERAARDAMTAYEPFRVSAELEKIGYVFLDEAFPG